MVNHLIKYFSQFVELNKEEIKAIKEHNAIKEYKKGDILLKEGQLSIESFLILKGCVKSYYIEEGEEHITEFYTENELVIPVGFTHQETSAYFLSCVEDCVLSAGTTEKTNHFLQKFPRLAPICLQISHNLLAKKQISFDDYRILSPDIRYQKFIENRPKLINRIPQYMVASYLGVKPQSLSRIRNRLAQKA